jgi:hypothetical protein
MLVHQLYTCWPVAVIGMHGLFVSTTTERQIREVMTHARAAPSLTGRVVLGIQIIGVQIFYKTCVDQVCMGRVFVDQTCLSPTFAFDAQQCG